MRRLLKLGLAVVLVCAMLALISFCTREDHRVTYDKEGRYLPGFSLKEMAFAMHRYAEDHAGRLPPAAVYNQNGMPLLSWRVLLLPYLEERELFRQFKLNEPWDSPHNLSLLPKMPYGYCPLDGSPPLEPYTTLFQVFVGKGSAFEGAEGLRLKEDITRLSYTILIVEARKSVPWTKPEDIVYDEAQPLPELGGFFKGYFHVVMGDGHALAVRQETNKELVRTAINRHNGGSWPFDN